jgi:hypothetical protein
MGLTVMTSTAHNVHHLASTAPHGYVSMAMSGSAMIARGKARERERKRGERDRDVRRESFFFN